MEVREPAVAYSRQKMTIEEYLAFENASSEKHEYYQGEVFLMSGAKVTHNRIAGNTFSEINQFLKGRSCTPYNSDQRIYIEASSLFTYPDISIFCGDIVTWKDDQMNAVNPSVIIEVLSPATKVYNRELKFKLYKAIASLKEYILIDSETVNADVFTINENGLWEQKEYKAIEEILLIQTIQMELPLRTVYEGTKLQ